MTRIKQLNNRIFEGLLPSIAHIKKKLLQTDEIQLFFLGQNSHLKRGTVSIFCGYRGGGFCYFTNMLAQEVTKAQGKNTLLVSDIILKDFMQKNLKKSEFNHMEALFFIEDDFEINSNAGFVKNIEMLVVKNNISLLLVYPFLMPEEDCIATIRELQNLAKKHQIAIVMNIPLEDYLRDDKTLLTNSCEKTFLEKLRINKVFRLQRPLDFKSLNDQRVYSLETYYYETGSTKKTFLKLDEKRQMFYNSEDKMVKC